VDRQRQGAVTGAKLPLKPRSRVEVSQGFLEAPFPLRRWVIGGQRAFGGVVEAGGEPNQKNAYPKSPSRSGGCLNQIGDIRPDDF
jgi:hypothetical protein